MRTFVNWLLVVALLFSPLAMQPAAASSGHSAIAETAKPLHCDPAAPTKGHAAWECGMACASALPAFDLPSLENPALVCLPATRPVVVRLSSLTPEAATPPPRSR